MVFRVCIFQFELLQLEFHLNDNINSKMTVKKKKKNDTKSCIRLWMKSTYSTSAPKRGQLGLYMYIQLNDMSKS